MYVYCFLNRTEGNYNLTSTPVKHDALFDDIIELDYGDDDESITDTCGKTYSCTTTNRSAKRNREYTEITEILGLIKKKCENEPAAKPAPDHIDHFFEFVKSYLKEMPKSDQDDAIGHITNYLVNKNKNN